MNHLEDTGTEGNNYDSDLKKEILSHIRQTEVNLIYGNMYYRRHKHSQDLI